MALYQPVCILLTYNHRHTVHFFISQTNKMAERYFNTNRIALKERKAKALNKIQTKGSNFP